MDPLDSFIVGEEDCTVNEIVDVFFNDANSGMVFHIWSDFARELGIKSYQIEEWGLHSRLGTVSIKNIFHKILEFWKGEKGKGATLPCLIKHLENRSLKNVADDFRNLFTTENRLQKDGGLLFTPTLPKKPNYYIPRTLKTRRVIDAKVFSLTHKDVFVFHPDGIDRHQLSKLAEKNLTDTSTSQVRKQELCVRFILLENFGDWDLLCNKTTNSIHLLKHHEERFHWISTKGNISSLQNASDEKNQTELSEVEFIEEIEADIQFRTNQPICISDSPGMGKSLLLANIGRQLQQRYPPRCIAFIVISEFTVTIRALKPKFDNIEKAVRAALLQALCANSTARDQLVQKIMTTTENPSTQMELMFDGFDEVSTENFELAHECLEILKTKFNSTIRIWITTRPHYLHILEQRFSVLGYNIQAFQEKNQIDFLTSFWKSKEQNLDSDRLDDFSQTCLSTLKEKLNKKDEDIAGIPLQCMMIAEVYMQDAHRFSDSKNKRFKPNPETSNSIDINSITDLYGKLITHKIRKFIATYPFELEKTSCIFYLHLYLALELIFPSHAKEFKDSLHIEPGAIPDYLVNIGILERRGGSTEDSARFIHRTFAEYLAACYFVKYVMSDTSTDLQHTIRADSGFLFEQVLDCSDVLRDYGRIYYNCSFKYLVLCHFLNALLGSQTRISAGKCTSLKSPNFLKDVLYACIHSDFGNLLRYLRSLLYSENVSIHLIFNSDSKILFDAITIASLDLLKFLLQNFEHKPLTKIMAKSAYRPSTVLHAAVLRGSYSIFEYILKEHHFEDLVKQDKKFLHLVYCAVKHTLRCETEEIQDRVQIVTVLCELNKEMLNYCDIDKQTPLLAYSVHIVLLKKLIECGANFFQLDARNKTILHIAPAYLSSTDFYDLLQFIPNTNLNSLLQMCNAYGDLSFHCIVKRGVLTQDSLNRILSTGFDINTSGNSGKTCIFYALDMHNEEMAIPTLKLLLENGADHTRVNSDGDSILHYSIKKKRMDCLRFFVEDLNMNVNQTNKKGETPIFHALCFCDNYETLETVQFLLERGAHYQIIDSSGSNLLHCSANYHQPECLELFLSFGGLDINQTNDDGDTPLMCAVRDNDEIEIVFVEHRIKVINLLLSKGADYSISNKNGNNVLHFVADSFFSDECFNLFVGLPSLDVNVKNCHNDIPLHLVCKKINKYERVGKLGILLDLIEKLLLLGSDINAINDDGETPLDICEEQNVELTKGGIWDGFENCLEVLLTIRSLLEDGIVHCWARRGEIDRLRFLLDEKNMNINQTNKHGNTPIFDALRNHNSALETVKFLLERGADYKILNSSRRNLLHCSVIFNQPKCLELFLSLEGLDINQIDDDGHTPLLCTISEHYDDEEDGEVEEDEDNEEDGEVEEDEDNEDKEVEDEDNEDKEVEDEDDEDEDDDDDDPEDLVEMIKLLLSKGADHTISNKDGNNILHLLAEGKNDVDFSPFVGLPSVDVNVKNCDNDTPLHLVINNIENYALRHDGFNSLLHNIEQLRSLGADVNAKNKGLETPYDTFGREVMEWLCNRELMLNYLTIRTLLLGQGKDSEKHNVQQNNF